MKWILTFLVGAICGAGAVFVFLSGVPLKTELPAAAPSVTVTPSATPAVVAPLPAAAPMVTPAPAATPTLSTGSTTAGAPVQPAAPALPVVLPAAAATDARPAGKLLIPVIGIKANQLSDTFTQMRGTDRRHEALDIMAPKGREVIAVADGKVVKLFNSKQGGLTAYQFDTTEKFSYYYAHLDRYAPGVIDGAFLKRGDLIGYVGNTGNADPAAPHLHFAVYQLTAEKEWWKGTPINPYPLLQE